jgi:4-amino-4-deoxy-L-arabinose transferase-like glycosyltransferase
VRLAAGATAAGIIALLFAPTVWSAVSVRDGGGGGLPAAGPAQRGGFGFPGGFTGGGNPGGGVPPDAGQQSDSTLLSYLEANRGNAKFLVAVPSSMSADSIIISTGEPVMAMGGFSGSDPILTAESVAQLVQDGTVRFFLLGGGGPGGGFGGQQSATQWVTSSCTAVPSSAYQSSTTTRGGFGFGRDELYDCASATTNG